MVEILIRLKADINAVDKVNNVLILFDCLAFILKQNGLTPLHFAAQNKNIQVAETLITARAIVNALDKVSYLKLKMNA